MKTIEVAIVHVKHPNTRSPIRRLIYYILEREAYQSDLGWIVLRGETITKLQRLAERAKSVEGINEAVKIYWISMPAHLLEELMRDRGGNQKRGTPIAQNS